MCGQEKIAEVDPDQYLKDYKDNRKNKQQYRIEMKAVFHYYLLSVRNKFTRRIYKDLIDSLFLTDTGSGIPEQDI